ncbi:UNVERIFIED_CONTAM: hypothetical protein GTU68_033067 [Idotea baltica]|nr:hypothetical protein [Idotea baltica]
MTFKEIQELIKLLNKTNLAEFKVKNGDFELAIRSENYSKQGKNQIFTPVQASAQPIAYSAPSPAPAADAPESGSPAKASAPVAKEEESDAHLIEVKSPIVGTFYRSSSPDKPPYIKIGDDIQIGSVVCIVEAMKLFNEIESEVAGKVVKVMIEDAQPVQYDQVLFLVDPKG